MTPRDRRAVRLGVIAVGVAFAVFRVAPWAVGTVHEASQRVAAERAALAETRALITAAPGLEDSLTHLTRRVASLASRFLQGESSAAAQADLANRVTVLAERSHLTVDRIVPVADSLVRSDGALHRVTVQASLSGDLAELIDLLDTMGKEVAVLTPAAVRLTAADPAAPVTQAEVIRADLTVTGWYFVPGSAP